MREGELMRRPATKRARENNTRARYNTRVVNLCTRAAQKREL
jgi:hypothetical protein